MADIKSKEERSRNMSAIRSKNTVPEIYMRKLLFAKGYRYRLHSEKIPGHPDIWLAKYNTAIFVHGCFWHRHQGCRFAYIPKSRIDFWTTKFEKNHKRDGEVKKQLEHKNIRCLIVWECTIRQMMKDSDKEDYYLGMVERFLDGCDIYLEL